MSTLGVAVVCLGRLAPAPRPGWQGMGASLGTAALPSCCVSLLETKNMWFVVGFVCGFFLLFCFLCFFEKVSVTFHLSISVDPVNAAPTTSTRVFYISVGVCCAVIFLVAIILAVLHLHSMKRIELDDRYVFTLFKCIFGRRLPRLVGVLVSK